MLRRLVIALMLIGVASSANATMTVIFKYYKAAKSEEKAYYKLYLDGLREGIIELNVVLQTRKQPLFCMPGKLALTDEQAEDIIMRQAEKVADPDTSPIGFLLIAGLIDTFPCQH